MSIAATSSTMMGYIPIPSIQLTSFSDESDTPIQPIDGVSRFPTGAQMGQKLQDLLDQQVNAGSITQDQALAINDFFAQVSGKGDLNGGTNGDYNQRAKDGFKGLEDPSGIGRRGPLAPPLADQGASQTGLAKSSLDEAFEAFIQAVKDSQAKTTSYGVSTLTVVPQTSTALFVDKQV